MTYQEEELQLIVLAQNIKKDGFSFSQDGSALSAMARILYNRGAKAKLKRSRHIEFITARFKVFASEFEWDTDGNDDQMFFAFAQLVVDWPGLLPE